MGGHDHTPHGERAEAADDREHRDRVVTHREVDRGAEGAQCHGLFVAKPDDRHVRHGERDHRAERVEVGEQRDGVAGQHEQQAGDDAEDDGRDIRRHALRVHTPEDGGHLPVLAEGVREARHSDETGIGGNEKYGRGKDADPWHEDRLEPRDALGHETHDTDDGVLRIHAPEQRPVHLRVLLAALTVHVPGRLRRLGEPPAAPLLRWNVDIGAVVAGRRSTREHEGTVRFMVVLGDDLDRHRLARARVDRQDVGPYRHGGQGRHGDAQIHAEHRDEDIVDRAGHIAVGVGRLFRHVRHGLDARVGDRADRDAVDQV